MKFKNSREQKSLATGEIQSLDGLEDVTLI